MVFGSSGARNLPQGTSAEEGYEQVSTFVGERVLPHLLAHDMVLAMEPIGAYEANFINTLSDGMRVVNAVGHPRVRLLADSVHMQYAHEDPQCLRDFAGYLAHIHLCEPDRALPLGTLSPAHRAILETIAAIGYQGTISFEPMPYGLEDMRLALQTVKAVLEA